MRQKQAGKIGTTLQLVFSVLLLAVAAFIFLNRQYVIDSIALWQYEPTTEVSAIRDNTAMTDLGERYFYASHPEINPASQFNANCAASNEESIILGCYTKKRIYIFDVTDERLKGVKEVTAAHEMLHAAYDRLSKSDKENVDRIIVAEMKKVEDSRIKDLIELYRKTEPEQLENEMHSILATEMSDLSSELEQYYTRYFTDRQKVVALSQQYESVFGDIEKRRQELVAELNELNQSIKIRSETLNQQSKQLTADITAYNRRADTPGGFSSQGEADRERNSLMARRNALQQERSAILAAIDSAKQIENQYKALMGELESLNKIIDSTPDEVPQFN